jgi:hypothetical protein
MKSIINYNNNKPPYDCQKAIKIYALGTAIFSWMFSSSDETLYVILFQTAKEH